MPEFNPSEDLPRYNTLCFDECMNAIIPAFFVISPFCVKIVLEMIFERVDAALINICECSGA